MMNTQHQNSNGNAWNSEARASRFEECEVEEFTAFESNSGGGACDVPFATLCFRQWIKLALESAGSVADGSSRAITSSDYLIAALNIAISLARQIQGQPEGQLSKMGYGCDWADCVYVRVMTRRSSDDSGNNNTRDTWGQVLHQMDPQIFNTDDSDNINRLADDFQDAQLTFGEGGVLGVNGTDGAFSNDDGTAEDLVNCENHSLVSNYEAGEDNQSQTDSVLHECLDLAALHGSLDLTEQSIDNGPVSADRDLRFEEFFGSLQEGALDNGLVADREQSFGEFFKSLQENESETPASPLAPPLINQTPPDREVMCCLNILTAELQSNSSTRQGPTAEALNSKAKQIFHLGLVLYEMFSGGSVLPSPKLHALALSDGAFMSLRPLTLTENAIVEAPPAKRRVGPTAPEDDSEICRASCNRLKSIGVPPQLCQLIYNMLDCVHGDLSGDESYSTMDEVIEDLQLMLDRPLKFLRGSYGTVRQSFSGLQLQETFMPRDNEFAEIQSCYRRSILGPSEVTVVSGESGSGKTWLCQRIGRFITAETGVFLSGKFDQMEQSKPFSALALAFTQYCDILIAGKNSDWAKETVRKLHAALGQESCHLINVIPRLGNVLTPNPNFSEDLTRDQSSLHALQRLCYLMCQFAKVICETSTTSVCLWLDDLQWADKASYLVLNRLLLMDLKKFFFLTSIRDDEVPDGHPFHTMRNTVTSLGIMFSIVKLDCMTKDNLKDMLSNLLCLPPRLVKRLAHLLYTKTKGNPLFCSQILLTLYRDGLLRLSLPRQRWVWDEEEIFSMKLPDDIAVCFANGMNKLPFEVQTALKTLSMFGASTKFGYLAALESQLHLKLIEPLKIAAEEGLVSNLRGTWSFVHDRIQEAAYGMIDEAVRCHEHSTYGLCLLQLSLESNDDDALFTATHQVNLGGRDALVNVGELSTMAKVNLRAGKRAIDMADYSLASKFLNSAMSFLPDNHWSNHYEMSLEIFELACKAALVTRNVQGLQLIAGTVLSNARSFEDRLNTNYIVMISLACASKLLESLDYGISILSQLGENLPSSETLTHQSLVQQINLTQSLIRGLSEEDILNYRRMTDKRKLMAMKFLAKLESCSCLANPMLHPFITLKMVQLTLSHGLSDMSPVGLVYFGSLLAKNGNIQVGYRFSLLAKQLADKLDAKEVAGEVIGILCEVQFFVMPFQSSMDLRAESEKASLAAGDITGVCVNRLVNCSSQLWASQHLATVKEAFAQARQLYKKLDFNVTLLILMSNEKIIQTLLGLENELTDIELERSIQNTNCRQALMLSIHLLYVSFVFDSKKLKQDLDQLLLKKGGGGWILFCIDSVATLVIGLSSFKLYRESRSPVLKERGLKCITEMETWANSCAWNFQQKLFLLLAERDYSDGQLGSAEIYYHKAIERSIAHKFKNDEAFSYESVARFYLDTGDAQSAIAHFKLAHRSYSEWGASAKADKLFLFVENRFGHVWKNDAGNARSSRIYSVIDDSSRRGSKRGSNL